MNIVSGAGLKNGVLVTTDKYRVTAKRAAQTIEVTYRKSKLPKLPENEFVLRLIKAPIIRGLVRCTILLFYEYPALGLLLVVMQLFLLCLKFLPSQVQQPGPIFQIAFYTLMATFVTSVMLRLSTINRYHSVEHKIINCVLNDQNPSFENLEKMDSFSEKCGSVFLSIALPIVFILLWIIGLGWSPICIFLAFSFTFEVRSYLNKPIINYWLKKAQKLLACWPPSTAQLEVGLALWQKLVELDQENSTSPN